MPRSTAIPGRRWRIAWLLGLGVLVNYFDRVNLSVSHDSLVGAFGISDVVFGYLSSAYNWTYAACQLPIGVILDKFGVRRVGRPRMRVDTRVRPAARHNARLRRPMRARVGCNSTPTMARNG